MNKTIVSWLVFISKCPGGDDWHVIHVQIMVQVRVVRRSIARRLFFLTIPLISMKGGYFLAPKKGLWHVACWPQGLAQRNRRIPSSRVEIVSPEERRNAECRRHCCTTTAYCTTLDDAGIACDGTTLPETVMLQSCHVR
jgi:hypothetical protein